MNKIKELILEGKDIFKLTTNFWTALANCALMVACGLLISATQTQLIALGIVGFFGGSAIDVAGFVRNILGAKLGVKQDKPKEE
jgi:hypothetical protein